MSIFMRTDILYVNSSTLLNVSHRIWLLNHLPFYLSKAYEVCAEGIHPCNMENRDIYWRRYKIQEILYIGQWCFSSLQSRHFEISHSSLNCHQLPHRIFLNLISGLKSLPFWNMILVLGKARNCRWQIWAVGGLSHLRDWMFHKKTAWDVRHEWVCCDEAVDTSCL